MRSLPPESPSRRGGGGPVNRILPVLVVVVLSCVTLSACGGPSTNQLPALGPEQGYSGPAGLVAYVANTYDQTQGVVQSVCLADGKPGPKLAVGGQPFSIAVEPGGKWAYVANSGWGGPRRQTTVTPINLITGKAAPSIQAGLGPMGVAFTPDGKLAYVADMGSFLGNQASTMVDADTVTPIDLASRRPLRPIVVGPGVGAVTVTPDGKEALVAIDGTETHPESYVEVMNLASRELSSPITVGAAPMAIAVTPDSKEALVTATGFRPLGHVVTPINLVDNKPGKPITVGTAPIDIVVTPDGTKAFVANTLTSRNSLFAPNGTVSTIDVRTNTPDRPVSVPGVPQALALTPDGKTVYEVGLEANNHSALAPIDVATGRVGPAVQLPFNLGAVAIARAPGGHCS